MQTQLIQLMEITIKNMDFLFPIGWIRKLFLICPIPKDGLNQKNSFSASFYSNNDLLINEKTNPESRFYVNPTRSGTQINLGNKRFPKISFRHGQSNLFPTLSEHKKWYNKIAWNYTLNYTNTERNYYKSVETDSSFSWERHDTDSTLKKYNEQNNGWIHTSSINAPQKIFKYISINPSLNLKSAWVNKTQEGIWNGTSLIKN